MAGPRAVKVATASVISAFGNMILWYSTGLLVNQDQFNDDIDHNHQLKEEIMETWGVGGFFGGLAAPIVVTLAYMLYVKSTAKTYHNEQTPLVQHNENKSYFSKCWTSLFNRNTNNEKWPDAEVTPEAEVTKNKSYGINP